MAKQPTEKETPELETPKIVVEKSSPPQERNYIPSPDSPWTLVHSDDTADTYLLELKNAGVVLRTETTKGSSSVFLANVNKNQLSLKA